MIALAIAALVFVSSLPATCPMRVLLHVPCPTCGVTRATRLALHGDLSGATHMHPLWMLVVPWTAAVACVQLAHHLRHATFAPLARWPLLLRSGQVLLVLLVVVWIARFFGAFGGPAPV